LGIDIEDTNSYGLIGKREAQMWRLIHAHCADLQDMFQQLTTLYTQVVALREARASNAQAKSVRWLTMLGTFFVPLSVVAGIMYMGADFLPGQNKFWVYFAVVGPLLLVMSLSFGLVTRWRGQDGS
jgi:Mg2+ and Co2+ transporter CorA